MTKLVVIIKPGFLNFTNDIIQEFVNIGFKEIQHKTLVLTQEQCNIIWYDFKEDCETKPYFKKFNVFDKFCSYLMSDNVYCIEFISDNEINDEFIKNLKDNLRKQYQVKGIRNLLHTSDTTKDAEREIICIFQ